MSSLLRRAPFYYGRAPERLAMSPNATVEWRSYVRLEPWFNAHRIADDFWEAPGSVVYTAPAATGGASASGAGTICRAWALAALGGLGAAGAASTVRTWARGGSGSAVVAGAAGAVFVPYSSGYVPSGGVVINHQALSGRACLCRAEHSVGTIQYRRRRSPWYRRRRRK